MFNGIILYISNKYYIINHIKKNRLITINRFFMNNNCTYFT